MTAHARHDFIYLASQSPRRAQLLQQLGVAHRPLLPDAAEDAEALEAERAGELPLDYVQRVTRAKLHAACRRRVARGLPPAPILVADTTVALGRHILGKPADAEHAAAMLRRLSGRTHRVITAVALAFSAADGPAEAEPEPEPEPEPKLASTLLTSLSTVRVARLNEADIAAYVAGGEPFGKAGAYAIQGRFAAWVQRIDGSYTGIMGLPLFETSRLLSQAGVRTDL